MRRTKNSDLIGLGFLATVVAAFWICYQVKVAVATMPAPTYSGSGDSIYLTPKGTQTFQGPYPVLITASDYRLRDNGDIIVSPADPTSRKAIAVCFANGMGDWVGLRYQGFTYFAYAKRWSEDPDTTKNLSYMMELRNPLGRLPLGTEHLALQGGLTHVTGKSQGMGIPIEPIPSNGLSLQPFSNELKARRQFAVIVAAGIDPAKLFAGRIWTKKISLANWPAKAYLRDTRIAYCFQCPVITQTRPGRFSPNYDAFIANPVSGMEKGTGCNANPGDVTWIFQRPDIPEYLSNKKIAGDKPLTEESSD